VNNLKTKNKLFFFFFISLFIFIPISSFTPTILAVENTQVLGVDLLAINAGTFDDFTSGDSIRTLKSSVGGRDLLAFENLGMVSYDENTKTAVYGGIITFGAEANAYTAVLCEDAYPRSGGTDFDKQTERVFLSYQIWERILLIPVKVGHSHIFSINYREIRYGQLYSHNYDGILPLNIEIDTGLFISKVGELEVGGQTFSVPKMTSDIKSVVEVDKRGGEVGGYEDRFTGESEGEEEVTVEIILPSTAWSFSVKKVTDWFNEEMKPVLTLEDTKITSIQQSVVDKTKESYYFTGVQDSVTIPYKVHIQPEMYRITQDITLKEGNFHWWKDTSSYRISPTIVTTDYKRNLAMHVSNVFVHTDFEIKVEVAMSCKFDAELSESFLEDPNLVISDRIWDSTIYGDKEVEIQLPEGFDWLMILLVILIVGVGVYVGYTIYKKRSQQKFLLRLAGRRT